MILINEDGQSISEIITCNHETDEYRLLKAIYNSDLMDESRGVLEYKKLKPEQFLVEVKKVLNLYNPIHENDTSGPKQLGGKILKPLNQIVKSYVFTADNFIKLILISLRLRTNIPVIMMGETGCGKTSLIRIVAELKNITMYTLNIHAGIEDKDIIEFINEKKLLKDNENQLNEEKEKTIWVFLDEINTCNSLGLITEIMLKRSCNGKTVKSNVKFIAACNPYRLDTRKREVIGLYDESKHLVRKLVYSVHPLPHSLLNFVFDFGTPEMEDIKRYISNMVHQFLKTIIFDYSILNKIKYIAERAIFDAQNFIKNNFEISSVSLREIRRWGILFEWFSKLLRNPYFSKIFEFSDD
jgi:ABC-type oligopeptide transport system ATPase subunit